MITPPTRLILLVQLVERLPLSLPPPQRRRGHPCQYSDQLFLKALVIMLVRRVPPFMACCRCWQRTPQRCAHCALCFLKRATFPVGGRGNDDCTLSRRPYLHTSPALALCWCAASNRGVTVDGRSRWIAPRCGPAGESGIRSIAQQGSCRTPRSIRRRSGANQAGMAGGMVGNSMSLALSAPAGFRWPLA